MVKQKVVLKVQMEDPKKKTKVMKLVAKHQGISSIKIDGDDKIAMVGDGIDPIKLIEDLRKQCGYVEVVTVSPVGEKEAGEEKDKTKGPFFAPPPYVFDMYSIPEPIQQPAGCCIM